MIFPNAKFAVLNLLCKYFYMLRNILLEHITFSRTFLFHINFVTLRQPKNESEWCIVNSIYSLIVSTMQKLLRHMVCVFVAVVMVASRTYAGVGLVLSGGGAKGVAHIGVIQALEENDIPIDYITGTSMGAIVGGLYAAGYSPAEMMALLGSDIFKNASTGTVDPNLRYYYTTPSASPQLYRMSLGNDSTASQVPFSFISPTVMNFAFMQIFAQASKACGEDFDKLFVPLRTVSSNIAAQRPEVSGNGRLPDAIRASMSFPMVFCPVMINDTLHYDGGIFDNFPVGVMQSDFHPDFMVGVDVHTPDSIPSNPGSAVNQINDLVTRKQEYYMPADCGVKIHIDLHKFSLLDFDASPEIYAIGYRQGLAMVDSIKSRTSERRPQAEVQRRRAEFKSGLAPYRFSKVECSGGTPAQNAYIVAQFARTPFGLSAARDGFFRSISGGLMQDLQVQAIPNADNTYTLRLHAYPKPAWALGLGGYISSSTTSMLFASVNYNSLGRKSASGHLDAWIGQSYLASQMMSKIRFGVTSPYALALQGVISKQVYTQTERMFFKIDEPKFVTDFQAYARAYLLQMPCGRHAATSLAVGYGYERYKFAQYDGAKIKTELRLGQLVARYDYNTLNAVNYPTSGLLINASAMGLLGHRNHNNPAKMSKGYNWIQSDVTVKKYWDLHKHFALGLEGELLASTRKAPEAYDAAIAEAPGYMPTPSCFNSFNSSFRSYSFLGIGVTPVWKINDQFQLRGALHTFTPWRKILEGSDGHTDLSNRPGHTEFFGEAQAVVNLKVVSLCAYGNYRTGSHAERGWHVGISLGIFALAPDFLK